MAMFNPTPSSDNEWNESLKMGGQIILYVLVGTLIVYVLYKLSVINYIRHALG